MPIRVRFALVAGWVFALAVALGADERKSEPAVEFPQFARAFGCEVVKRDGALVLKGHNDDRSHIVTVKEHKPPFALRVRAKTDSKNLRLYYNSGALVFNWERNESELRIQDPVTNQAVGVPRIGKLEPDQFHDIVWEIHPNGMRVFVNGTELVRKFGDYSKLEAPVGIGPAFGSVVTVKEFRVEVPKGKLTEETRGRVLKLEDDAITVSVLTREFDKDTGKGVLKPVERKFKFGKDVKIVQLKGPRSDEESKMTLAELKAVVKDERVTVQLTHIGENCSAITLLPAGKGG